MKGKVESTNPTSQSALSNPKMILNQLCFSGGKKSDGEGRTHTHRHSHRISVGASGHHAVSLDRNGDFGTLATIESGSQEVIQQSFRGIVRHKVLCARDTALKSPGIRLITAGTYDFPSEKLNGLLPLNSFGAHSGLLRTSLYLVY